MHRHAMSGGIAALLLVVLGGSPLGAQRADAPPKLTLDEPRPRPVLPMMLVPFSIPAEFCRGGRTPRVTLLMRDGLTKPIATLVLRGRQATPIDGRPLRCGSWVARWDGVWGTPPRLATPRVYWLQLSVDTAVAGGPRRPAVTQARKVVVSY